MSEFPIIDISGTPYECGTQYGEQAASAIQQAVEIYKDIFSYYTGASPTEVREQAEAYLPYIDEFDSDIGQELRGVATGANVPLADILALNARTELMSSAPLRGECTAFGVLSPATKDYDQVYLAQNWDWLVPTEALPVLLRIRQPGKPVVFALAEAGQLGKIGMNDAGFGICLNWLAADYRRMGVPVHIITRKLLSCSSVYEIGDTLYNHVRGAAANYLVAHQHGFLMNYETTPDACDFIEPVDGYVAHTNHFLSHRFRSMDAGIKISGDSFPRLQRVRRLLAEHHGSIDIEVIKAILRDQYFAPFGICTCPDPDDPELDRWSTLASVIFDLYQGRFILSNGNPSETSYVECFRADKNLPVT